MAAGPEKAAERKALAVQSVEAYRQSLNQNLHQSRVLVALAAAYDLAGEPGAAEKAYHEAIRMDPDDDDPLDGGFLPPEP